MYTYPKYQHYKGGIYYKLGEALHTETSEMMVIYLCAKDGYWFARPKEMFEDRLEWQGQTVQRFALLEEGGPKEYKGKKDS